jgi:hypothetical protein
MHQVIECTNLGIDLHEAGNQDAALSMFERALRLLAKEDMGREAFGWSNSRIPPSTPDECQETKREISEKKEVLCQARIDRRSNDLLYPQEPDHTSTTFIFHHMIKLEGREEPKSLTPLHVLTQLPDLNYFTAIVMYNRGLFHHLRSLRGPACRTSDVEIALAQYTMAYNLLFNMGDDCVRQDVTLCRIVMAILNNMSATYYDFGRYTISRDLLDRMSNFILSLGTPNRPESTRERDNFMLNALVFYEPVGAASA